MPIVDVNLLLWGVSDLDEEVQDITSFPLSRGATFLDSASLSVVALDLELVVWSMMFRVVWLSNGQAIGLLDSESSPDGGLSKG